MDGFHFLQGCKVISVTNLSCGTILMKTLALKNLCLKDKEPRVLTATQLTVTCSNSTIEALLKYVQGQ